MRLGYASGFLFNKMVSLKVDGGENSNERIAVLLAYNADETVRSHHKSAGGTDDHITLKISGSCTQNM